MLPVEVRDNITFVVQKSVSITMALLGASRVTAGPPAEPSLAVAQIVVGGSMLAVAAIVEVMMWRARGESRRRIIGSSDGSEDQLAERMRHLERALIDRLPPAID